MKIRPSDRVLFWISVPIVMVIVAALAYGAATATWLSHVVRFWLFVIPGWLFIFGWLTWRIRRLKRTP